MTRSVHVHQRIRPLRLAYVVAPDDGATLARAVELNTCLWGGVFNPIFPLLSETPHWWSSEYERPPTPREIFDGYRSTFAPDFFVFADKDAAAALELDPRSVLTFADVINDEGEVVHGVSVSDRYVHLWDKGFQFVRKQEPTMLLPRDLAAPLVAACCGSFPATPDHFEREYRDGFKPREFAPTAAELLDIQIDRSVGTPLRIGATGLGRPRSHPPCLFVLNPTRPIDLIDFWNLGALGWRAVAVPSAAADELSATCAKFIVDRNLPLRGNPEMKQHIRVVKSRSTDTDAFMTWARKLDLPDKSAASLQVWYPRMWLPTVSEADEVHRPVLDARQGRTECVIDAGKITFEPLEPPFAIEHNLGKPRWTEVIELRDYSHAGEVAAVLPSDLVDFRNLVRGYETSWDVSVSPEGIIVRRHSTIGAYHWHLPDGHALAIHWLGGRGRTVERSSAGRTAEEMLRRLGGPIPARLIAEPELIRHFDSMARPAAPKSDLADAMLGRLKKVSGNDAEQAERTLHRLVEEFHALRVGLQLQCPHCQRWNWYPLGDLTDRVACMMCLREFPFPASHPRDSAWAYRVQGPFAVANFAEGAYAVSLTLRFLAVALDGEASWATGLEVSGTAEEGGARELDLLIWWRESWFRPEPPLLMLGECKSFSAKFDDRFAEVVRRVTRSSDRVVLLFATLDSTIDAEERANIRRVVEQVRSSSALEARVLVLTGRELFSHEHFPHCWDGAGNPFERWTKTTRYTRDLEWICDATEAIYLGGPDATGSAKPGS